MVGAWRFGLRAMYTARSSQSTDFFAQWSYVWNDKAIYCFRFKAEILQDSVKRSEVSYIETTIDTISETPNITLVISPYRALLNIIQRLLPGKATPLPRALSSGRLCNMQSFTFEGTPLFNSFLKGADHMEPIWDWRCILIYTCQVFQFLKIKHSVTFWDFSSFDMMLEGSNYKSRDNF